MINVGQSLFLLVFHIQKPESQQAQLKAKQFGKLRLVLNLAEVQTTTVA